jgi:hypothetical protein
MIVVVGAIVVVINIVELSGKMLLLLISKWGGLFRIWASSTDAAERRAFLLLSKNTDSQFGRDEEIAMKLSKEIGMYRVFLITIL